MAVSVCIVVIMSQRANRLLVVRRLRLPPTESGIMRSVVAERTISTITTGSRLSLMMIGVGAGCLLMLAFKTLICVMVVLFAQRTPFSILMATCH